MQDIKNIYNFVIVLMMDFCIFINKRHNKSVFAFPLI